MNPFLKIRAAWKIRLSILTILLLFLWLPSKAQNELSLATPASDATIAPGVTADKSSVGLRVSAYLLTNESVGKIKILFVNPYRERVFVQLTNESNTVIYEEYTRLPAYNRNFTFIGCRAGTYTL